MARDSWLKRLIWLRGSPAGGGGASYEKTVGPAPIISISDAKAKPAKSLIVGMEPIQAGSGDPSPDNIRPITGRTGVTVERTGANLLDLPYAMDGATLTYNVNRSSVGYENGVLTTTLLTSESGSRDIDIALSESHRFTLPNVVSGYFTLSFNHSGMIPNSSNLLRARLIFTDNTGVFGNAKFNESRFVMTVSNMASFAGKTVKSITILAVYNAYAEEGHEVKIWNLQLEYSTTNVGATDYNPRTGATYPVAFPDGQTVYGGTVDVVSGVLTVTDAEIASYNGETLPSTWISDRDVYAEGTTPTIGAQVVYELATPQTYQLTPQQRIQMLKGANVLWSDADNLTLKYIGTQPANLLGGMLGGGFGGGYNPPAEQDPEELTEPEATETDEPTKETTAEEGENNGE